MNEWNNKAVEITGFTRQEVLGRDLVQEFITEEYRESVREVLDDALRGKETANFEFALYTKDKRRVDVLLNATTRRDLSGGVVGMIGVGQDITERNINKREQTRVAEELQSFIDTANAPIFGRSLRIHLSLSLSHTHTHTHAHTERVKAPSLV